MKLKLGYKQTEIGILPNDWKTRLCSAISDLITVGIVIRPTQYYTKQGVPALRSANIRPDRISHEDMVYISEKSNALLSKSQLRKGDVITVRTGYPGTSAVVPQHFDGANCIDILITRPKKGVDAHFLSAWINSSYGKSQVLRNQGGLAQQHFNVSGLRDLVVALPPTKAEQEAIAEALSDTDALIESLEQLIAKKSQIKQGAMQELLTGKRRLPGYEKKPGHKQTEVGEIPEDWEHCELGDAVKFLDGQRKPVKAADRAKMQGIYPYYGASGIVDYVNDYLFDDELILLGEDGENILSRNLPLAFKVKGKIWVNNHAHVLKPNDDFNISYLTDYLESLDYSLLNSGTAQPKLNKQTCAKIEVVKPTRAEQDAIAAILNDMDAETIALEAKLSKARQIKHGMMQVLLTGRIRLI